MCAAMTRDIYGTEALVSKFSRDNVPLELDDEPGILDDCMDQISTEFVIAIGSRDSHSSSLILADSLDEL